MESDGSLFGTHAVVEAAGRRFERAFPLPDPAILEWSHREVPKPLPFHVTTREEVLEEMRQYEAAKAKDRAV